MSIESMSPQVTVNPESGLIETVNDAACQYYGLSEKQLVGQTMDALGQMDALTQLPNRKLFLDRLSQAILESQRSSKVLGILFIDLDRFKPINDTLGHHAGDQLLQMVADRLQSVLREEDTLARLGGDEFVVLLKDIQRIKGVERVANELLAELTKSFLLGETQADIGGSIGIALYPQDAQNAHELLQKADLAMYRSKKHGRNQWSFFQAEMDIEAKQRFDLEQKIRDGLDEQAFGVSFLPIFNLNNHSIYALEAQLIWQSGSEMSGVEIEAIRALANQSYLGIELNRWLIEAVVAELGELISYNSNLALMVRVCPIHFRQKEFVEWLDFLLARSQILPQNLMLTLPPECLNIETLDVATRISELNDLEIQVVIEDFGSQGASLFQTANFDIAAIKLSDLNHSQTLGLYNQHAEKMTAAIMAFAHQLNPKVIASGLLNQEQLSFAKSQHCHLVQGSFFGESILQEDLEEFVMTSDNNRLFAQLTGEMELNEDLQDI